MTKNVVFCTSKEAMFQLYVAITSLFSLKLEGLKVYVIHDNSVTKEQIKEMPKGIKWVPFPDDIKLHPVYYRLYAAKLLDIDSCFYADADTIFIKSDFYSYDNQHMITSFDTGFSTLCTGIMFMNLKKIREAEVDDIWISEIPKGHISDEPIINQFTPKDEINLFPFTKPVFNQRNYEFMGVYHMNNSKPWLMEKVDFEEGDLWQDIIKTNQFFLEESSVKFNEGNRNEAPEIMDDWFFKRCLKSKKNFDRIMMTTVFLKFAEDADADLFYAFLKQFKEWYPHVVENLEMGNLADFKFKNGETAQEILIKAKEAKDD